MDTDWAIGGRGITVYPAGTHCGPRIISDWEFVWIVTGNSIYQEYGKKYTFSARSVALVQPGTPHGFTWDTKGYTRHGYIHFTMPEKDQDLPPMAHWPHLRELVEDSLLQPLLNQVLMAMAEGDVDFAHRCLHLAVRAFVTGRGCGEAQESKAPPVIEATFAWIADRWAENGLRQLALTDLARAVGVSPGHLDRTFHRYLGISPMEAQRRLRLDRAARLIRDGGQSVQAAAAATGFVSPFHCARRFRTCYGMSPSTLRGGAASGVLVPAVQPATLAWLAERVWRRVGTPLDESGLMPATDD